MEKTKTIDDVFKEVEKKFGKGTLMTLKDQEPICKNLISTGSLLIDQALGGGIAVGRVCEIFGVESSGKSSLCLQIAAQCQKNGGRVAYLDTENALDINYANTLGVNTDELLFSQPTTTEQTLELADMLAKSGTVKLIIIDSVAAMVPQAELDGEMSDMTIGLNARLLSKGLRKLTGTLNSQDCAIIFINQLRDKIATGFSMGPSETTPGGRALKFFASQRIELRKATAIKEKEEVVGNNVKVKVVKNKIAPPMKVCTLPLMFGKGFGGESEIFDIAIDSDICKQSGAWFTTHDGNRVQGRNGLIKYYNENVEAMEDLTNKVKAYISGNLIEEEFTIDEKTGEVIDG